MQHETFIRTNSAPWWRGIEVSIRKLENREFFIGRILWEPWGQNERLEPSIKLEIEQAQTLMDDLWNCGVRPTEGSGSAGAMRAAERHIDDLRKIAFKTLDIPTPQDQKSQA